MSRRLKPDPDWKLVPPDDSGNWQAHAYLDYPEDGWDLYWAPKGLEDPASGWHSSIPWPFGDHDVAYSADFAALGFQV